jgi:hypothetical protein
LIRIELAVMLDLDVSTAVLELRQDFGDMQLLGNCHLNHPNRVKDAE